MSVRYTAKDIADANAAAQSRTERQKSLNGPPETSLSQPTLTPRGREVGGGKARAKIKSNW